jgi:WS/DGAT/MGAT family acyltransferase
MAQGHLDHRLSGQDAAFLYNETDETPMHIGSVAVFEGEISFDRLVQNIDEKMHLIPRYRQRVISAPLNLHHPTWELDPSFDIRKHIIPVRLDPPGSDDQLRHLAARLFQGMLSRDKALWEIFLVHGLEGDRSALVSKVHHCLVDGVSGIELLMIVLDVSPNPSPPPPPAEVYQAPPISDTLTRFSDALFDRLADSLKTASDVQGALLNTIDNPASARSVSRALETALPYFARPGQRAPFNGPFSGERRLTWSECSFAEVRAIRRACGGTVNDVVLSVLGGALSRYYEAHDIGTEDQVARILTPVNVRREDERGSLGNRITMLLVEVPLGLRDPVERLKAVRERTENLKRNHVADGMELVADSLNGLPPMLQALFGALPKPPNTVGNLVCTNVPGPMIPLYCVGHPLEAHYPLVPIAWEMGVGCAVTSYNQKLYFGLMADAKAAPDVDRLGDFLTQSYVEMRSAAGVAPIESPDMSAREAPSEVPAAATAEAARPRKRQTRPSGESLAADAG